MGMADAAADGGGSMMDGGVGLDGAAAADGGEGIAVTEYCARAPELWCEWLEDCRGIECEQWFGGGTVLGATSTTWCTDIAVRVSAGAVGYDPARAAECLALQEENVMACTGSGPLHRCHPFSGLSQPGMDCYLPFPSPEANVTCRLDDAPPPGLKRAARGRVRRMLPSARPVSAILRSARPTRFATKPPGALHGRGKVQLARERVRKASRALRSHRVTTDAFAWVSQATRAPAISLVTRSLRASRARASTPFRAVSPVRVRGSARRLTIAFPVYAPSFRRSVIRATRRVDVPPERAAPTVREN